MLTKKIHDVINATEFHSGAIFALQSRINDRVIMLTPQSHYVDTTESLRWHHRVIMLTPQSRYVDTTESLCWHHRVIMLTPQSHYVDTTESLLTPQINDRNFTTEKVRPNPSNGQLYWSRPTRTMLILNTPVEFMSNQIKLGKFETHWPDYVSM